MNESEVVQVGDDHWLVQNGLYEDKYLYKSGVYTVHQLRRQRISENMQFVWNYVIVNTVTNVPEVFSDSLPGAMSIAAKLDNGLEEMAKLLAERDAAKAKTQLQLDLRAKRSRD